MRSDLIQIINAIIYGTKITHFTIEEKFNGTRHVINGISVPTFEKWGIFEAGALDAIEKLLELTLQGKMQRCVIGDKFLIVLAT